LPEGGVRRLTFFVCLPMMLPRNRERRRWVVSCEAAYSTRPEECKYSRHNWPDEDWPPTARSHRFRLFNRFLAVRNFCGVMDMAR